jgi:hypothetical protein
LRGALHLCHVTLRITLRANSLGPIFNLTHQLARAFFEIRNGALRELLESRLPLAFALRRFLIKRCKLFRNRATFFFECESQRFRFFSFVLDPSQVFRRLQRRFFNRTHCYIYDRLRHTKTPRNFESRRGARQAHDQPVSRP